MTMAYLAGLHDHTNYMLAGGTGSFGYEPAVDYFFGVPRSVNPGGVVLNKPIINVVGTDNNDAEAEKNYTLQIGMISSALEHATPEVMFADGGNTGEGISAVRAIQKAALQGQHIYRLTAANLADALPNVYHDPDAISEIRNAVNSGKEVVTHTDAVQVPGWSGAGYLIIDPETGAGAYKIAGGANGGLHRALGYVLDVMSVFQGFLVAMVTHYNGPANPVAKIFNSISQFINIAQYVHTLLDRGSNCRMSGLDAIIFVTGLFVILSALVVEVVTAFSNPIAAFAAGVVVDQATNWLISQTPDCI